MGEVLVGVGGQLFCNVHLYLTRWLRLAGVNFYLFIPFNPREKRHFFSRKISVKNVPRNNLSLGTLAPEGFVIFSRQESCKECTKQECVPGKMTWLC